MRTVTVTGSNLFKVAADELNDATQWIRLAQLNNLLDPMLAGIVTLSVPDIDPQAGGGIASQ